MGTKHESSKQPKKGDWTTLEDGRRAPYWVACGSSLEILMEDANGLAAEGFVPIGGLVIETGGPGGMTWFHQPMFRKPEEKGVTK